MNENEKVRRTPRNFSRTRFILVLILAAIFCPRQAMVETKGNSGDGQANGPLSRFNYQQLKKLRAGEPVCVFKVDSGESENMPGYGQCSIIFNAPIKKCFEILSNIENQVHYAPGKKKSKVVSKNGDKLLVDNEYRFYGATISYHSIYTLDEKTHRLGWEIDKSRPHDLDENSGCFQLEKIDEETTLLTYGATRFDIGFSIPKFIKESLLGRSVPAMVINIKKYIESNGEWRLEN